jgi:membrane protease YdiL (CAAX protease family)
LRIPLALAWLLLAMALFTAALLRQFHDLTPTSPFLNPAIGSLLFACVVFLVLVAVREHQIGAAPGPGVRLGSLTPFLLMLLVEKWVSATFYGPLFVWTSPAGLGPAEADARFRALCGIGLLAIVVGTARFSRPARTFLAARIAPARIVPGVGTALSAVVASGLVLGGLALAFGSRPTLIPPHTEASWPLVVLGQSVLSLGEEVWFRGLLLGELLRLAPRLGIPGPQARRWFAIATTALLFGCEHFTLAAGWEEGVRQLVFALALGTLFGMLVLLTSNLWFVATLHAWINLMLLTALPRLAYGAPAAALPPGVTISLALIGAFVAAFIAERRGYARTASSQSS